MRIGLLPLDERPVNTRLPQQVGAVAGAVVSLPPEHLLSARKRPADTAALTRWLEGAPVGEQPADALVVSLDMLGFGGLIASRTSNDPAASVLGRWETLRRVRRGSPGCAIHGVSLVTRAPNSYDSDEEPDYWQEIGADLHRLGGALHRDYLDERDGLLESASELRGRLPGHAVDDFTRRRLRNHTVNLAALSLACDKILDTLLITADDTAERSAGSLEQHWLAHWRDVLAGAGENVLMHPGADEVATVLVARTVLAALRGEPLRIAVVCAVPGGLDRVAPYENVPLGVGARGHIRATGSVPVEPDGADLVLVVHPPDKAGGDWAHRHPEVRRADDADVKATAEAVASYLGRGAAVAVADCAYPNGSDPALLEALSQRLPLASLAGYAGWNTAGNTLGSVIAQGALFAASRQAGTFDAAAHRRLLLHRLVEDGAYMADARGRALAAFTDRTRHSTLPSDLVQPVTNWIAGNLADSPASFPGFEGWTVAASSVRLPWQRTFELDFELTAPDGK
ncbi:DUF4127 family protein [Streptomyces sp. NPDC058459]|uniref:DUF4127 family protein n=1 Tax=Streptomyces sp. NPDC058459 TaxID=3346508 RepID=UPI003650E379